MFIVTDIECNESCYIFKRGFVKGPQLKELAVNSTCFHSDLPCSLQN